MIRSWYENLQRGRKRESRKDVQHAFVAKASGRSGSKHNSALSTRELAKIRGGRGRRGHKKQDEERDLGDHTKSSGNKAGGGNAVSSKVNSMEC